MGYRSRYLGQCLLARTFFFHYHISSLPVLPTLEFTNPILTDYDICFSQTIGRAVEPLDELPQDQEDPVSHLLSNMTDEDLKTLSVISRRMLNSLDQASGSES